MAVVSDGLDDTPLCDDQQCPYFFVQPECSPEKCRAADLVRQQVGAIYMIDEHDDAQFVSLLPGSWDA